MSTLEIYLFVFVIAGLFAVSIVSGLKVLIIRRKND
jgi:hypothetical protein